MGSVILKAVLSAIEAHPDQVLELVGKLLDLLKDHPELVKVLIDALVHKE
jgi:hypothetical protein